MSVETETPKIVVDREFASLCPPLSKDEILQLEDSLKAVGCTDPLLVWEGCDILLDGHNRLNLTTKLGIPFNVKYIALADREAAKAFVMHKQLGRRNITPEAASYLRGRRYLDEKKGHGGKREASPQSEYLKTSDRLAEEFRVSRATIQRDGQLAKAVDDIVKNCGLEYRKVILSGEYKLTRGCILSLAKKPATDQKDGLDGLVQKGRMPRKRREKPTARQAVRQMAKRIYERDEGHEHARMLFKEMARLLDVPLPDNWGKVRETV